MVNPVQHVKNLQEIVEECNGFKNPLELTIARAWGIQTTFMKMLATSMGREAGILYKISRYTKIDEMGL